MYSFSMQHAFLALVAVALVAFFWLIRGRTVSNSEQPFDDEEPYGVRLAQDELDPANPDNLMLREEHHRGIYQTEDHTQSWSDSTDPD